MSRYFPRSLAGQAITLVSCLVAAIVVVGGTLAALDARADGSRDARQRVTAVATSLALAPSTAEAIRSGRATAVLQPLTEQVRAATGTAFITVMAPDRTRFTHTNLAMIGGKYLGSIDQALRGRTATEVYTGTLGPSVRAVAPVRSDGAIVGLVAVGITQRTLTESWYSQLPLIVSIAAAALVVALVGLWLLRRRLLRTTGGLSPTELRVMYEHHDAVLHSVSEGLIVTEEGQAALVNDEARRLLDLPADADANFALTEYVSAPPDVVIRDELHVVGDRVLMVNRVPVESGRSSAVITLRDRTELLSAIGELDSMTRFAESVRSAAHESANRLHTIVTLIEMGKSTEAVRFATDELTLSQRLVDRVTNTVAEPTLAALLLGKTAQANDRGISLEVTDETDIDTGSVGVLSATEMVTVVGNLIDNAMDASDPDDPWVEVTVRVHSSHTLVAVADSGPGMDADILKDAQRRGYSTKPGGDAGGRGLGLALVTQIVRRHHGTLSAENTYGSVVTAEFGRAEP